jgi:hypothetical protein
MARRTFTDIVASVMERLGNRGDATQLLREQWTNDALLKLSSAVPHPELEGYTEGFVLAGSDMWNPTVSNFWWPKLLKCVSSGKVLEPDNMEHVERVSQKTRSHPSRYYFYQNRFWFNSIAPEETSDMRLWYYMKPQVWTTGESPLGREFDLAIELYATSIGLGYFREFEKQAIADNDARNYIAELNLASHQARLEDNAAGLRPRLR